MKSEKVKEFIDGCINNLTAELADHAKWQIWTAMTHTADLAEREAEERTRIHWLGSNHAKERSKTYPGIAQAMAEQWGNFLKGKI